MVIEDAPFGVMGAVAAGMRAIGYAGDAHAHPQALSDAGAEVVTSMAEVPGLLGIRGRRPRGRGPHRVLRYSISAARSASSRSSP